MDGSQRLTRSSYARKQKAPVSLGSENGEGQRGYDADNEREERQSLNKSSSSQGKSQKKRKRRETLSERDAPSTQPRPELVDANAFDRVVRASLRQFERNRWEDGKPKGEKSLAAASLKVVHDTVGSAEEVILSTGFGNVMLRKAFESSAVFVSLLKRDYPGQGLLKGSYSAFIPHIPWDNPELMRQVLSVLKTPDPNSLSTRERETKPKKKRRKKNEPSQTITSADDPDPAHNQAIALLIGVSNSENQRTGILKFIRAALRYQLATPGVFGYDLFIKEGAAITQAGKKGLEKYRKSIMAKSLSDEAYKAILHMSDSSSDEGSHRFTKKPQNDETRESARKVYAALIATPTERQRYMGALNVEQRAFVEHLSKNLGGR